jgi:peptide/nickel transport system permease protein
MVVVNMTLSLAGSIGMETGLSILGFGLSFETPSLGTLVGHAMNPVHMQRRWWMWMPAVILILIISLAITFVGQALNRAADSRQRRA